MRQDVPHIVQSFLFHANVVGPWAAHRAGVPHVLSGIRVAERQSGWHLRMARWSDRWVDKHVCVSQSVREFSAADGGLPAHKLLVIPNGVDLTKFSSDGAAPLDLHIPQGRRLIACVGRLESQKNLPWLFERLPAIFAAHGDYDLLLVGEGPQRATLQQLAARLGIVDRVLFAGYRDDVPAILAASDVLVLPSRWEGMPNVVLEAMAAAKPVVATDVEGVSELLGPAAAQQVVRPGHAEAFAAKLRLILSDKALAAALGSGNRQRCRSVVFDRCHGHRVPAAVRVARLARNYFSNSAAAKHRAIPGSFGMFAGNMPQNHGKKAPLDAFPDLGIFGSRW